MHGQLSIEMSIYGQSMDNLWTIVHELTFLWIVVHAWTIVHSMDNLWTIFESWTIVHRLWTIVHVWTIVHMDNCP